eukprot:RCo020722
MAQGGGGMDVPPEPSDSSEDSDYCPWGRAKAKTKSEPKPGQQQQRKGRRGGRPSRKPAVAKKAPQAQQAGSSARAAAEEGSDVENGTELVDEDDRLSDWTLPAEAPKEYDTSADETDPVQLWRRLELPSGSVLDTDLTKCANPVQPRSQRKNELSYLGDQEVEGDQEAACEDVGCETDGNESSASSCPLSALRSEGDMASYSVSRNEKSSAAVSQPKPKALKARPETTYTKTQQLWRAYLEERKDVAEEVQQARLSADRFTEKQDFLAKANYQQWLQEVELKRQIYEKQRLKQMQSGNH